VAAAEAEAEESRERSWDTLFEAALQQKGQPYGTPPQGWEENELLPLQLHPDPCYYYSYQQLEPSQHHCYYYLPQPQPHHPNNGFNGFFGGWHQQLPRRQRRRGQGERRKSSRYQHTRPVSATVPQPPPRPQNTNINTAIPTTPKPKKGGCNQKRRKKIKPRKSINNTAKRGVAAIPVVVKTSSSRRRRRQSLKSTAEKTDGAPGAQGAQLSPNEQSLSSVLQALRLGARTENKA